MAELVDALVSGTSRGNPVGVRVSLPAQKNKPDTKIRLEICSVISSFFLQNNCRRELTPRCSALAYFTLRFSI